MVVGWQGLACGAFSRYLERHFDRVYGACCVSDAETVLETCRITHVVVFAEADKESQQPLLGALRGWRKAYGSISRVVLVLGAILSRSVIPSEVDYVVELDDCVEELLPSLGGRRHD